MTATYNQADVDALNELIFIFGYQRIEMVDGKAVRIDVTKEEFDARCSFLEAFRLSATKPLHHPEATE